jgi:hypothetical protein
MTTIEKIRAHNDSIRRSGPWTAARRFDVRTSSSSVVLDLLLPELEDGDIEIAVDLNRSMLKLLVPEGAVVESDELRRVGRGRVKDWTGTAAPDGRVIRIVGEMRDSELRVNRGGVAILESMLTRDGRKHVREAHRAGRLEPGTPA